MILAGVLFAASHLSFIVYHSLINIVSSNSIEMMISDWEDAFLHSSIV